MQPYASTIRISVRFIASAVALSFAITASGQHYMQTNLVSNVAGKAATTDANLVNAWGLSRSSTSPWWVSDNGTGMSTLYDGAGVKQALTVTVPGDPTGTVFNGSQSFQIVSGKPAVFMFASEDGTISGWNPGVDATNAKVVVATAGAVYKGLAIALVDGAPRLYATDFHAGRVRVFDANFQEITASKGKGHDDDDGSFKGSPRGLVPFNIQNLGGTLYVTFAKQDAAKHDEVDGPGLGLVGAFTPAGKLIRWFDHVNDLNAPWGVAIAPSDFGAFSHSLLVGQFGSGEILAYNLETGDYTGKMLDAAGNPLAIDGLWGISFGNDGKAGPATTLYFAAGPDGEANGLFGSLTAVPADNFLGNGN